MKCYAIFLFAIFCILPCAYSVPKDSASSREIEERVFLDTFLNIFNPLRTTTNVVPNTGGGIANLGTTVSGIITNIVNLLGNIVNTIVGLVQAVLTGATTGLTGGLTGLLNGISQALLGASTSNPVVNNAITAIGTRLQSILSSGQMPTLSAILPTIIDSINQVIANGGANGLSQFLAGLNGLLAGLPTVAPVTVPTVAPVTVPTVAPLTIAQTAALSNAATALTGATVGTVPEIATALGVLLNTLTAPANNLLQANSANINQLRLLLSQLGSGNTVSGTPVLLATVTPLIAQTTTALNNITAAGGIPAVNTAVNNLSAALTNILIPTSG